MKKLSRSLMACSVLVMLAVSMSSCRQDLTAPTPSVEQVKNDKITDLNIQGMTVQNGMLTFTDYEAYSKAKETLVKADFESYKAYCEKIGFKSLALLEDDFFNDLEKCKTIEEVKAIQNANQDIFDISDEQNPQLKNTFYPLLRLLNRNSMFKVDKALYLFDEKGEIIAKDGNINNMNQAVIDRRATNTVTVFNASQIVARTKCGWQNNSGWQVPACNPSRRGNVYANLFYTFMENPNNLGIFNVVTTFSCYARAQKHTWTGWNDYKTDNYLTLTDIHIRLPFSSWTHGPSNKFYANQTINTTNSRGVDFSEELQNFLIPISSFNMIEIPSFVYIDVLYSNQGCVNIHYTCDN